MQPDTGNPSEIERGHDGRPLVWKLLKAIYGTKQAARLFVTKLREALISIGFEQSIDDESIFRLQHNLGRIIITVHMDDIIGGAENKEVLEFYRNELPKYGLTFSATGRWSTVMGFGASRNESERSVTITAKKHIETLAANHLDMEAVDLHPATPALPTIEKLPFPPNETPEEEKENEEWRSKARSLFGALLYVAVVHLAIQQPVSMCCQHMSKPTRESYVAAKRILAWLRAHKSLGVTFSAKGISSLSDLDAPDDPPEPMSGRRQPYVQCCVDANLNGRTLNPGEEPPKAAWRSQLGFAVSMMGGTLDAVSRRQHSTALDTPCSEIFAASAAAAVLIHIQGLIRFITFGLAGRKPVPLWCDNEVAVNVSQGAASIKRLAYIARRAAFLRELESVVISMRGVSGEANPADIFTKLMKNKERWFEYIAYLYNTTVDNIKKMCGNAKT
jgi:hypothetical protein